MFRDKFWLSLILTIPVLAYSEMIQHWLNFTPPAFPGSQYVPFVFSTIIFFYGGLVFIKGAWGELKAKLPGMMTLISLAIITAYVYSVATQFWLSGEGFFWELATLITIMLLGHWLEMASIAKAENALDAISKLLPDKAEKLVNGKPKQVLVSELKVGDLVLIRPGSNIPVDGTITNGSSSVNEAAITGESKPTSKAVGDEVVAGTINQDELPFVIVPSTGIFEPGRISTRSPTFSSLTSTCFGFPLTSFSALSGRSLDIASRAFSALAIDAISSQCPSSIMVIKVANSQKKPSPDSQNCVATLYT
jgi:Cu2+-exporting ATPase